MFAVALIALLALVDPSMSQITTNGGSDSNGEGPDFQPDPLTSGILALFCIFTFLFFLLAGWCFVTLILARGHRAPYAFLFPALILSVLGNAGNIALEVFLNMPSWYTLPIQLQPALEAIGLFPTNWATLLLFLSIIAVLWNRETALYTATEGKAGHHNHGFTAAYAILALVIFVLGTASPAVYVDALRQYLVALNEIDFDFDADASLEQEELYSWFYQRLDVSNDLGYALSSVVVLAGVVAIFSIIRLWRAGRAAGIRDKIADTMLYVVAPLYAAYNLFTFIFTIVFSNHGLPPTSSLTTFEGAALADNLLLLLSYSAVAFTLLFMSIKQANWNIQGGTVQPTNVPTQQYWPQPMQPYYGPQQYMQPHIAQPVGQPAYYYNGPQPMSYLPGPQLHETSVHSPSTQPESLEDPSKAASPA